MIVLTKPAERANCDNAQMRRRRVRYPGMTFEQALKDGDLDVARAMVDELAELPGLGRRRVSQ